VGALPGSFVRQDENLDAAAVRTLEQRPGSSSCPAASAWGQLQSYGAPGRDPRGRVISVAYVAFGANLAAPRPRRGVQAARFWPVRDLGADPMTALAFDHMTIVRAAVERTRSKIEYTALATTFLSEPFSLSELRTVYEEI